MKNLSRVPLPKARPALFQALGRRKPPEEIQQGGKLFRLSRVFKHDSWAATAVYQSHGQMIVCKFNRQQPIFFIPMSWLGRKLARREAKMLQRLAEVAHVPQVRTDIYVDGQVDKTAVAHDYVPGKSLKATSHVDDHFFDEFWGLLHEVHQCGIAYIDLHKAENVLVCDKGKPHLIDFQVSVWLPDLWVFRGLLKALQRMDRYHFARHKLDRRPDLCGETIRQLGRRPWFIRVHRFFARPLRQARRRLLVALGVRTASGQAETELVPEECFREAA